MAYGEWNMPSNLGLEKRNDAEKSVYAAICFADCFFPCALRVCTIFVFLLRSMLVLFVLLRSWVRQRKKNYVVSLRKCVTFIRLHDVFPSIFDFFFIFFHSCNFKWIASFFQQHSFFFVVVQLEISVQLIKHTARNRETPFN